MITPATVIPALSGNPSAFGGPQAGEAISSYLTHRTYAEIATALRASQRHINIMSSSHLTETP